MKGRKRVDKCFSFSEIPVMLTLLSEQATLVLMTTSEKNRPNLFGEKKLAQGGRLPISWNWFFFSLRFAEVGSLEKIQNTIQWEITTASASKSSAKLHACRVLNLNIDCCFTEENVFKKKTIFKGHGSVCEVLALVVMHLIFGDRLSH